MKTKSFNLILILVLIFVGTARYGIAQPKSKEKNSIQLFNGKDLGNWDFFLKDAKIDPQTVFTIQNGILHISGSFGYMRTKQKYSNYKLHLEYRWPAEATNSGIFIHAQMPDTIWVESIECQLQAGNAGDFICMGGTDMKERIDKKVRVIKKMAESSEKPVGEWNSVDIIAKGNTLEVSVNGVRQNKGTGLNVTSGNICLQSEGKEIEFKNVVLTKL